MNNLVLKILAGFVNNLVLNLPLTTCKVHTGGHPPRALRRVAPPGDSAPAGGLGRVGPRWEVLPRVGRFCQGITRKLFLSVLFPSLARPFPTTCAANTPPPPLFRGLAWGRTHWQIGEKSLHAREARWLLQDA